MEVYFLWGSIALLVIALGLGFLGGFVKGLKRSSLHFLFVIASFVVAFFITKPISQAVLGSTITADGVDYTISEYIVHMIGESFDLSNYATAENFLEQLPNAIVSPILFILLAIAVYVVFEMIYLIVSRISFGKKKADFAKSKPHRVYGGLIGLVEGFLFLFVLFAPLTALTKTYQEISALPPAETQALAEDDGRLKTVPELLNEMMPAEVNEAITAYNNSLIGKVCGVGGLDKALFDGLSNFEFEGENINLREELVTLTTTYDSFVEVYNNVNEKNYLAIDFTDLKANIEKFLNNGIFKKVVSETVKDFVTKIDVETEELPQIVEDLVVEIKAKFLDESFDVYEYLKADILALVDAASVIIDSEVLQAYDALEDKSFVGILELVDDQSEKVESALTKIFDMNLVTDGFKSITTFLSDFVEKEFENEKGLEVGLNTNITDKDKMVDDVLAALSSFVSLNDKLDISTLMDGGDVLAVISEVEDLGATLDEAGVTFDKLNNLELLILTKEDQSKVCVFENILKLFNLDILKDVDSSGKQRFANYIEFFSHIKTPIVNADKIGLLDFNKPDFNFDNVLDSLLEELKTDKTFLTNTILPFKDITALDLNKLVFDKVVDEIEKEVSIVDFKNVTTDWETQLNFLGETLNALNAGNVEEKTYIKFMIGGGDMEVLLDAIVADDNLKSVLNPVFSANIFDNLISQIFDSIDTEIGDNTGAKPKTDTTNLKVTKDVVIADMEKILKIANESEELSFTQIGKILDVLKASAYNDTTDDDVNNGTKDGVFNNIFANLIWYLTGDVINDATYTTAPCAFAETIKAKLDLTGDEYYFYASYETALAEVDAEIEKIKQNTQVEAK